MSIPKNVVYIGRKATCHGRPLWEILMNLKDYGVGRIVYRSRFTRYPEKSYYRILSVKPHELNYPGHGTLESIKDRIEEMRGEVTAEKTFRGVTEDHPFDIGLYAYKADFFLVPKHDEEAFLKEVKAMKRPEKIYPSHFDFPPLWQELIKRDKMRAGLPVTPKDLVCPAVYRVPVRVATEGETPDLDIWDYTSPSPHLYADVEVKPPPGLPKIRKYF